MTAGPSLAGGLGMGGVARIGFAVARRPGLWITAARQWRRTTPAGWWRRRPYLPVPPAEYVRFRVVTQYGGDGSEPVRPADVLAYLQWCKRHDQAA